MAKFKVGDKVAIRGGSGNPWPVEAVETYESSPSGYSTIYRVAVYWRSEDILELAPTKKRYEIIRVVEAENEEQALNVAYNQHVNNSLEAREIK